MIPLKAALVLALAAPASSADVTAPPSAPDGFRPPEVEAKLEQAKQQARKIPLQAKALIGLAWPAEGPVDPLLCAAARAELVDFGHDALPALRLALPTTPPRYQADLVATFIDARYQVSAGMPPDYLPGLDEAIWYGTPEARRLALIEISRFNFPPFIVTAADAAYEDFEIARVAMRALGRTHDTRARVFLTEALTRGNAYYKPEAAEAIATLGGAAINILREAVRSDDPHLQSAAVRALLPHATVDDLSALYEYAARHPDEDPALAAAIHERTAALELELAEERDAAAASGAEPQ